MMYADDTVIDGSGNNIDSNYNRYYADQLWVFESLAEWCNSNRVSVNNSKTKTMLFGSASKLTNVPRKEQNYMMLV